MSTRNVCLVALAALSVWSCASTVGAPPFDEESYSGTTFWIISPFQNRNVYSFHWNGELLSVARSSESGLKYYDLSVDSCPLLEARLIQFRESILDSVNIVFVRKPAIPVTEIVMDGPLYRVKYAPGRFNTSVQLEGYESGGVPWVAAAQAVQQREAACTDN
ncbi:MAG: hypothetical protein QNK34_01195 [Woeseiaceae bacterium]|nr:hypothetical protein [Woeseiaceae bacterium]